jgi:hypothetical protein
MNPMKNYLYLRISQKDPFDMLYFTPSLTWMLMWTIKAFPFRPEMLYTGITNLELRLKGYSTHRQAVHRIRRKAERLSDRG